MVRASPSLFLKLGSFAGVPSATRIRLFLGIGSAFRIRFGFKESVRLRLFTLVSAGLHRLCGRRRQLRLVGSLPLSCAKFSLSITLHLTVYALIK